MEAEGGEVEPLEVEVGSRSVGVGKRGFETGGGQTLPSSSFRLPGGDEVANGR